MSEKSNETVFEGKKLYGDDFNLSQILEWYKDEYEGYADLGSKDKVRYRYGYHALNCFYGFDHLPPGKSYQHALGFGSAYGDELKPVIKRIKQITILEPSDQLRNSDFYGIQVDY